MNINSLNAAHDDTGNPTLFVVNPEIPLIGALEQVSHLLDSAHALCSEMADEGESASRKLDWASVQLIEMSQAVVEASIAGILQAK